MRTKTVEVREGELLGPVDWSYDFESHDWDHGGSLNPACLARSLEALKALVAADEAGELDQWEASNGAISGGRVLAVGMYDGWPYWAPTPSVLIRHPLGSGEWTSVFALDAAWREATR